MLSFQILVLGFLFVSFRPSWLRSHSCSTSASLLLSLSVFSLPIRFLSSASLPVLATQPLFLPFLFLPVSASQWLPRCALSVFTSLAFPVLPDLISHVFFPGSSYSAFCLFPFIPPGFAPTAVPPVLPFCSRSRAFPFQSAFLSIASLPVLTTQPLFRPFLFLPVSASQWLLRCVPSALASLVFPVLPDLISHVFFPSSSYSASCMFPFVLP